MKASDYTVNRYALFAKLREMWKNKEPGRTYSALASKLGVPKQLVSQWATGSGSRSEPPWSVLVGLCDELDLGIAIEPDGVKLYELPDRSA